MKVLSKNKAREKDAEEHRIMEENHSRILGKENKDEYELDKALNNKVLKRISDKGKRMFDLLNKSGDKYKEAIFWYMKKIIKNKTTPLTCSLTTLIPIWKKKGSSQDLNMMRYIHTKLLELWLEVNQ